VETLLITNKGIEVAVLKAEQLPYCSGFEVLNAVRSVKPGATVSLVLCFQPHEEQGFK